jgi:hypothetical protein
MPYISPQRRADFEPLKKLLESQRLDHSGELNYAVTIICQAYLNQHVKSYQTLNEIHGALACVQQEFYRRVTAPYEADKIKQHEDI